MKSGDACVFPPGQDDYLLKTSSNSCLPSKSSIEINNEADTVRAAQLARFLISVYL